MSASLEKILGLVRQNRWQDARLMAEDLSRREPLNAQLWFLLGAIHGQLGAFAEAEVCCRRTVQLEPRNPAAHYNLGIALLRQNRPKEAGDRFSETIRLSPGLAVAYQDLGNAQAMQGALEAAADNYRKAITLNPSLTEAHYNLGHALQQLGHTHEAMESYRNAVRVQPDHALAHYNLGTVLWEQGAVEAAVQCYREAVRARPDLIDGWQNLGAALQLLGRLAEATESYRRVLALKPEHGEAHVNLGLTLWTAGRFEEAIECCARAIALRPGFALAHNAMALVLLEIGRLDEAAGHCRRAIADEPSVAEPYNTLGTILNFQGRPQEALEHYRQALGMDPSLARASSNLLFTLNYLDGLDGDAMLAEHRKWAGQQADYAGARFTTHANDPDPDRRLRIGYVSQDFCQHSVALFFEPVLASHDRGNVEVYCYASVARPDATTQRLKGLADHWRDIAAIKDVEVAELVRQDGIDILVDLGGHSANNRLSIFARHPAPVQATYLGYLNTTGLTAMDYRITDEWCDPPGVSDALHTETLVRIPGGLLCLDVPHDSPEVTGLPALKTGHITFGCFNNCTKITSGVIAVWSRVLKALPDSYLVLKSKSYADMVTRRYYTGLFEEHGISAERVGIEGNSDWRGYLESHHRIDIALDPFPYAGGTVTCHALWMGVPVVTLAGRLGFARTGVSILSAIGLQELIADSCDDYVERVLGLARDLDRLGELRASLRQRMQRSTLMDAKRFAGALENQYRSMWRQWCAERGAVAVTRMGNSPSDEI